jgi:hypothetical protein
MISLPKQQFVSNSIVSLVNRISVGIASFAIFWRVTEMLSHASLKCTFWNGDIFFVHSLSSLTNAKKRANAQPKDLEDEEKPQQGFFRNSLFMVV